MNHRPYQTIEFFCAWGAIYGMIFGVLLGTLVIPVYGTMFGIPFGFVLGLMLGLFVGIGVAFSNAIFYRTPYNLIMYRRRYTFAIGLVAGAFASLLFIADLFSPLSTPLSPERLLLLFFPIVGTFLGVGLSSGYAASWYSDWYTSLISKQKNDIGVENALVQKLGIIKRFAHKTVERNAKTLILVGVVIVVLVCYTVSVTPIIQLTPSVLIQNVVRNSFMVVAIWATCVVVAGYATLFINRILLLEYGLAQSLNELQRFICVMVCTLLTIGGLFFFVRFDNRWLMLEQIFLLGICVLIPLFAGWRMTDGFGEWYFRDEKVKSKPKMDMFETEVVET